MITLKSKSEIEKMRKAGKVLAEGRRLLKSLIRPGITTSFLDKSFEDFLKSQGCIPSFKGYGGFPASICASVNDTLIHGIPNDVSLKEGDVLSIDMGVIWKGYHADSAFTVGVGKISSHDKKLISVAEQAFWAGVNAIKPGARVGDVSAAVYEVISKNGMDTPREYTGHGIGSNLHEDPYVPNIGEKGKGPLLRPGMCICIEPMILQKSSQTFIEKDGWTVKSKDGLNTSHYEHTIYIKDNDVELLTEEI